MLGVRRSAHAVLWLSPRHLPQQSLRVYACLSGYCLPASHDRHLLSASVSSCLYIHQITFLLTLQYSISLQRKEKSGRYWELAPSRAALRSQEDGEASRPMEIVARGGPSKRELKSGGPSCLHSPAPVASAWGTAAARAPSRNPQNQMRPFV